jgi:hypothetical protein
MTAGLLTGGCTATTPEPKPGDINISSATSCIPQQDKSGHVTGYTATVGVTNDGQRLIGTISMTAGGTKLKKTYPGFPGVTQGESGKLLFGGIKVPPKSEVELVVKQDTEAIARAKIRITIDADSPSVPLCTLTQLTP